MTTTPAAHPLGDAIDASDCEREPIHVPGSIQPHGVLLVFEAGTGRLVQASANAGALLGGDTAKLLGRPLDGLFGDAAARLLRRHLDNPALDDAPQYLGIVQAAAHPRTDLHAIAHRRHGIPIIELEPLEGELPLTFVEMMPLVQSFIGELAPRATLQELADHAAREVRRITGFDRVLVYRFDADFNGHVIAEDRARHVVSYLDHWFPAADIPPQARELYRLNRLRLIANATYDPAPLVPAEHPGTGQPLDLTFATLRSVSPVHLEYLRNMGEAASMSISIVRDGRLWGLIACHHRDPLRLPFPARIACDLLGQVFSLQLAARELEQEQAHRIELKSLQGRLLTLMAQEERFIDGLVREPQLLLEFAGATGAAVLFGGACMRVGQAPPEEAVLALADWLADEVGDELFATERLCDLYREWEPHCHVAAGAIAIAISKLHHSYVIWFRPEVELTVKWGGDPRTPVSRGDAPGQLHPRTSFETWRQVVRGRSLPWEPAEVDAARELRNSIVGIVLRKAEELAGLSDELQRANRELEAFSYSVSHDLRAPFRHIVGYAELLRERIEPAGGDGQSAPASPGDMRRYVDTIIESARYAGTLVDNLLAFSQIGRTALHTIAVDLGALVEEEIDALRPETAERAVEWRCGELPAVKGDPALLRLAVRNLLENAVKYTRPTPAAVIAITRITPDAAGDDGHDSEVVIRVKDNGVGFDARYVDKLFGVFQRLHRMEDFEGTGIGLANVRRIVARHGGRTWAHGAVNKGASFYFTLPLATDNGGAD